MKNSLYVKIGALLFAFVGVIYGMKALRSSEADSKALAQDSALAALIGADLRPYSWCPKETSQVEVLTVAGELPKTLTQTADISALCELIIGPVTSQDLDAGGFEQRLSAEGAQKEKVILEQIPDKPIFRVKGLTFSSPMLIKALARIENP